MFVTRIQFIWFRHCTHSWKHMLVCAHVHMHVRSGTWTEVNTCMRAHLRIPTNQKKNMFNTYFILCFKDASNAFYKTLSSIQQKPRRASSCVIYTRDLLQYIFFDRIYIYMCRLYVCTRVCSVKHVFKKFWRHIMFVWRTSLIWWTNIDWVDYMLWNSDDVVKDVAYFYIFRESDNFVRDILN
jgi:hypothetical protein